MLLYSLHSAPDNIKTLKFILDKQSENAIPLQFQSFRRNIKDAETMLDNKLTVWDRVVSHNSLHSINSEKKLKIFKAEYDSLMVEVTKMKQ